MNKYDTLMKQVEELKEQVAELQASDGPRTPDLFGFTPEGVVRGLSVLHSGESADYGVREIDGAPLKNRRLIKLDLVQCMVGDVVYFTNSDDSSFDIATQYRLLLTGKRNVFWMDDGSTRISAEEYKYCYKVELE